MKKNIKKLISVTLSAAMVIAGMETGSGINVSAATQTISVKTYEDLESLGESIASAGDEVIVSIDSDIESTSNMWDPITISGKKSVTINGNGNTIKGLSNQGNLNKETVSYTIGLFKTITDSSVTFNDLTLDSVEFTSDNGVGAFVGYYGAPVGNHKLKFNNCKVTNTNIKGNSYMGSFVGGAYQCEANENGPLLKCALVEINECKTENTNVSAPATSVAASYKTIFIGGIVGYMYCGNITNTESNTKVTVDATSSSGYAVGGIVGGTFNPQSGYTNTATQTITNCVNKGDVTFKQHGLYVGGIIGCGCGKVSGCTNEGVVDATSSYDVGGIAGILKADIASCTNNGNVFGLTNLGGIAGENVKVLSNCTNTGKIDGSINDNGLNVGQFVGGLVGLNNESATVKNSSNSGSVNGGVNVGGNIGYNKGTVENVTNSADVTGIVYVGGNIGYDTGTTKTLVNSGNIEGEHAVGGNIGFTSGKSVTDLTNSGNVTAKEDENGRYGDSAGGNIGHAGTGSVISNIENSGDVIGKNNIGGNIGYNQGTVTDAVNHGNTTGEKNIGGNVGNNTTGATLDTAFNDGDVKGDENVGGNVGLNSGTTKNLNNEGDVTGNTNVGGNIGDNTGKSTDNVNSGDVTGNTNVGGNIGYNENTGDTTNNTNLGKVTGDTNTDSNIGKDDGKSSDNKDLYDSERKKDDDKGTEVVVPGKENKYRIEKIQYIVTPTEAGAIYAKHLSNDLIKLTAVPVEGYKFKEWKLEGCVNFKEGEKTDASIIVNYSNSGNSKVIACFDKVREGDNILSPIGSNEVVPADDEVKVEYEDGLVIAVKPAKGGKVDYVSSSAGRITLTATPANGYEFDKWELEGSAKIASGSNVTSTTATFAYGTNKAAKIIAVFKAISKSAVDGPKAGATVKDKKYIYKVVKAGSTDGKTVGEVKVTGLRKKTLKTLKIAALVTISGVKYKVVSVGKKAFKGNKKATKVYVGKNVKTIEASAYANMKKLKSVVINSTVLKKIAANAFAKDKKLAKVTIKSKKLKNIGKKAFFGDKKLKNVILKTKKLKSVGKKAFYRKGGKKLTIKVVKSKKKAYAKLFAKAKTNNYKVK